jgi:hypothetical protein
MFTVDLLKGRGIPIRSRPEGVVVAAFALAVPVIAAMIIFGCYISNGINISIQKQQISNYRAKIEELSEAVELQKTFEREKSAINGCLSEVASSIGRYTQWSPVLTALAQNMPSSIALTRLDVKQRSLKKKMFQKDGAKKMTEVAVPVTMLQIGISGNPGQNCDKAVKDFQDSLRFSPLLGSRIEDIKVSQQADSLGGHNSISYEIDCIFKPQF